MTNEAPIPDAVLASELYRAAPDTAVSMAEVGYRPVLVNGIETWLKDVRPDREQRAPVRVASYKVARTVWQVECDYCGEASVPGIRYPCATEAEARQLLAHHLAQAEHKANVAAKGD
jgi:hypothetical protein